MKSISAVMQDFVNNAKMHADPNRSTISIFEKHLRQNPGGYQVVEDAVIMKLSSAEPFYEVVPTMFHAYSGSRSMSISTMIINNIYAVVLIKSSEGEVTYKIYTEDPSHLPVLRETLDRWHRNI